MNLIDEFEHSIKLIIRDLRFNCSAYVSTFEINIRALGGLISGHIIAVELKKIHPQLSWYHEQLLELAINLADKLIYVFKTETYIPYRYMNLNNNTPLYWDENTCSACAGTFILEFGALSYLSGNDSYLEVAIGALDFLWISRDNKTNLVGSSINIHTGKWTSASMYASLSHYRIINRS
uniref:alpha-1,2-Mannosidase n=1 Tax=Henneguya salminicola TaxID=69463 RepID=A0A6G3MFV6_HENSL